MSLTRVVIGEGGCPTSKIVSCIQSSLSFHLLYDNWSYIANSLETSRVLTKKLRTDFIQNKVNLGDITCELIEEWIGRKGKDATLQVLLTVLKDNGLTDIAESLEKEFPLKTPESFRKYLSIPNALQRFLTNKIKTKICILLTPDVSITCQKLLENLEGCLILEWEELTRSINDPKLSKTLIHYVKIDKIPYLQQLMEHALKENKKGFRVVVIAEQNVMEKGTKILLDSRPRWKQIVNISFDKLVWSDLTMAHKHKIVQHLEEVGYQIPYDDGEYDKNLNGQILIDLINEKKLKLFKDTLPDHLSYYVERRLRTRYFISMDILQVTCSDIFTFTGLDRFELSRLVEEVTDQSTYQIQQRERKLTVKHMTLDKPSHFDEICDMTNNPVHLLRYENGKLIWIQSRGDHSMVQKHVDHEQKELSEQEFCEQFTSLSNRPIIISDTPGMGKSVLLGELGLILQKTYSSRVVFFVNLPEFIGRMKMSGTESKGEAAAKAIEQQLCMSFVGREVFRNKLNSKEGVTIELLLDGYDEVANSDLEYAQDALKNICSFPSIRLWVTARPHMMTEVEKTLGTLAFNIIPFRDTDQLHFLQSYWSRDEKNLNQAKLLKFAEGSLNFLKTKIRNIDHAMTGIPLQCLLLGEVYEENAITYATTDQDQIHLLSIDSITNLYNLMIVKKFQKYFTDHKGEKVADTQELMGMHVALSLELLFPHFFQKLKGILTAVGLDEVLKVGIVESSEASKMSRFLHRTFAEYFVARYVVDQLQSDRSWGDELKNFFRYGMLQIKCIQTNYLDLIKFTPVRDFVHFGVNYFFNSLLNHLLPRQSIYITKELDICPCLMLPILQACALNDFVNVFKLFSVENGYPSMDFDDELLTLASNWSGLDILKLVLSRFEENGTLNVEKKIGILGDAIGRGEFSIVEFLIKEKRFGELVKDVDQGHKLIHRCVDGTGSRNLLSFFLRKQGIESRIAIIRMLVRINREIIQEKDSLGNHPIFSISRDAHVDLLIELIKLGADVCQVDKDQNTFLHVGTKYLSAEEFNSLIIVISDVSLTKLVHIKNSDGETLLFCILKRFDPLPETLEVLKTAGTDFKLLVGNNSPMTTAIVHKRSEQTFNNLILHGANTDWKDKRGHTFLHLVAGYGSVKLLKLLLEQQLQIDAKQNNSSQYPLQDKCKDLELPPTISEPHQQLIKSIVSSVGNTLLHAATRMANLEAVRYLLQHGQDVNHPESCGNTSLHLGITASIRSGDSFSLIKLLMENSGDPSLPNKFGMTPTQMAIEIPHIDYKTLCILKSVGGLRWTMELAHRTLLALLNSPEDDLVNKLDLFIRECAKDGVEVDMNFKDQDGNSLLHTAANFQYYQAVRFLVEEKMLDVNGRNKHQETALHKATRGFFSSHQKPASHSIPDNFKGVSDPQYLLYRANKMSMDSNSTQKEKDPVCINKILEHYSKTSSIIIKYLIERGALVNAKDAEDFTFLHGGYFYFYSSRWEFDSVLNFLIENNHGNILETGGGPEQLTPLHCLVKNVDLSIDTLLLLRSGNVNFNVVDKNGLSVLAYAVAGRRDPHFISSLIEEFGADPKCMTKSNQNLLHIAAHKGSVEVLQLLLDLVDLDVNGKDIDGNTPLHLVMLSEHAAGDAIEKCKLLLSRPGAIVNSTNNTLRTPLHLATRYMANDNGLEVIRCLLENEADPFMIDENGLTFLHFLFRTQNKPSPLQFHSLVKLLLEKNFSQLFSTHSNKSITNPLHFAVWNLELDNKTLALLDSHGALLSQMDPTGYRLLSKAIQGRRSTKFMASLLSYGAKSDARDTNGQSLLHVAAESGTRDSLEFFISRKLDVNEKDTNGDTPLHFAMLSKNSSFATSQKLKGLAGPNPTINSFDDTILNSIQLAKLAETTTTEIIEKCDLLMTHGALINSKNIALQTPLHFAALYPVNENCPDLVRYLLANKANAYVMDKGKFTFLHHFLTKPILPSPCQFHSMIEITVAAKCSQVCSIVGTEHATTVLGHAVFGIEVEDKTLSLLQSIGANFNAVDTPGYSILNLAVLKKRTNKLLSNLIKYGANWRVISNHGTNLLHTSAGFGTVESLQLFLDFGVLDINLKDCEGNTPLHYAMCTSNSATEALVKCKLLMDKGATVNVANNLGETPDYWAAKNVPTQILESMTIQLDAGADSCAIDLAEINFFHCYLLLSGLLPDYWCERYFGKIQLLIKHWADV